MSEAGPSGTYVLPVLDVESAGENIQPVNIDRYTNWIHKNSFPTDEDIAQISNNAIQELLKDYVQSRDPSIGSITHKLDPTDIIEKYHLTRSDTIIELIIALEQAEINGNTDVLIDELDNYESSHEFELINNEFNKRGYLYRYFEWVNTNFYPVAAKVSGFDIQNSKRTLSSFELALLRDVKDRVKLTPETFGFGYPSLDESSYNNILKRIRYRLLYDRPLSKIKSPRYLNSYRYIGWSPAHLEQTIIRSEFSNQRTNSRMGILKSRIFPELQGYLPKFDVKDVGIIDYYASIYRKLFNTIPTFLTLYNKLERGQMALYYTLIHPIYLLSRDRVYYSLPLPSFGESMYPPTIMEKFENVDVVIDYPKKTLINWIHANAYPTHDIHLKIFIKLLPYLKYLFSYLTNLNNNIDKDIKDSLRVMLKLDKMANSSRISIDNIIKKSYVIPNDKLDKLKDVINYIESYLTTPDIKLLYSIANSIYDPLDDNNDELTWLFQLFNMKYASMGYYYHYFGWINVNFDPVRAKLSTTRYHLSYLNRKYNKWDKFLQDYAKQFSLLAFRRIGQLIHTL